MEYTTDITHLLLDGFRKNNRSIPENFSCDQSETEEKIMNRINAFLKAQNQKEELEGNEAKGDIDLFTEKELSAIQARWKEDYEELIIKGSNKVKTSILDQAKELVDKGRQSEYGKPERNIGMIADLWGVYLDTALTEDDVCNLMALLKIARLKDNPEHVDSDVDLVGYTYLKHVIRASNEDA